MNQESVVLGQSDEQLHTENSDELRQALETLTQQATRSLDIYSHQLDSRLYNGRTLHQAMLALARHSRLSLIRIIVRDTSPLIKKGSRIVQLSQRISSRVLIRKPPVDYKDDTQEFVIADGCGFSHRPLADRYEGELCFNAPLKCRQLSKFFDECWHKSAADPELRHLMI